MERDPTVPKAKIRGEYPICNIRIECRDQDHRFVAKRRTLRSSCASLIAHFVIKHDLEISDPLIKTNDDLMALVINEVQVQNSGLSRLRDLNKL